MSTFTDETGAERAFGCLEAPLLFGWPEYGAVPSAPLVPEADWKRLIDAQGNGLEMPYLTRVMDQKQTSSCNACATASAIETARLRQGLAPVRLSAGDLYRRICGGRDAGSSLEAGLEEATRNGVSSEAACPFLEWQRPPAAPDMAGYRVLEAFLCPTFAHRISAVLSGFDLIAGVPWNGGNRVGQDGWLVRAGANVGGHAVHCYRACYRGAEYGLAVKNSWAEAWGLKGRCVFPRALCEASVGGWWAVRQVTTEAGDVPVPQF